MAAGVDSPESGRVNGIALEFPVRDDDTVSSTRIPRRLRERLLECKTPSTVEEIEAKLRHADLRRQQFYEKLSSKARPKCRSPSRSSSNDEDLGQRLEAKLLAAEQKRLNMLAMARMRLARLDELRQAAKNGVALRFEKERKELGTKVESRVQQAERNRMLLLKAYSQRRATLRERTSQSLLRRMARESKYKERVRAAIHQKRVAAEKKRLGLLEAEKKRARARVLQVWRVAKSVSNQREIERRQLKDQLEDRLQRAKRQRAEYLRQRGRLGNSDHVNSNKMQKQADFLSRELARYWRRFLRQRKTTLALAKAYDALQVNEKRVKSLPFEQLAVLIESTTTLQTVKALLDRFESRIRVSMAISSTSNSFSWDNIDHLLKRVASPNKRVTPKNSIRSKEVKKVGSIKELAKNSAQLSRYQVRVVLCAYMILGHPDAVFSGRGEREFALAKSAEIFVKEFELLLKIILEGPIQSSDDESDSTVSRRGTFRPQLSAFDKAWCTYLNCFVAWKVKDARTLEEDLVRAACHLELSMIQTCKLTSEGDSIPLTHDMKAIQKQVAEDQKLLREKVQHLSGSDGIERMECALADTRTKYFQSRVNGSPSGSPITNFLSTSPSSSLAVPLSVASSDKRSNMVEGSGSPSRLVRSLFREESSSPPNNAGSSSPKTNSGVHLGSSDAQSVVENETMGSLSPRTNSGLHLGSSDVQYILENELMLNEIVHEQHYASADSFEVVEEDNDDITAKIKETMEKAFWDGIMESMEEDEPNYDRLVDLIMEVRDGLCEMAPQSWKQEICEAIDLDILSQVLKSATLDMGYLGNILEFALATLRKLSAPAKDDELKETHQKLLEELAEIHQARDDSNHSVVITLMKGLRFVLEQIEELKREISKARIRMIEPLLKGPAGLEYLRKAFVNRYGSPSDVFTSLPLTVQWLSSVWGCKDQEWDEHKNLLTSLESNVYLPSTTLRTGGNLLLKSNGSQAASFNPSSTWLGFTGNQQPECSGERIDLLVRLGLLKLVSGASGLTQEALPETLKLNFYRMRNAQAKIQEVIVIATSVLIFRQTLLSEQVVTSPLDMERALLDCTARLFSLFDRVEMAGLEQIVETISGYSKDDDEAVDAQKLQSRKAVMSRMLAKSLQAGDPVFKVVSRAVYLALRGVVLGGSGPEGVKLAETALRQVGAAPLTGKVVETAENLVIAASVSVAIHGPWYTHMADNM